MASPFASTPHRKSRPAALARWLWWTALLVILVVAVGGITRLTESGLSITEWEPVTGIVPPISEADWQRAFDQYRQTTEYQQINAGMTLGAFKTIFFWEWLHRILGRLVGIAMVGPLLWYAWRRAIPQGYGIRLFALTALVGMQGAIGWWMVTSGLAERTDVSHFRLAAHLLTALFLLAGLVWTAQDLRALARHPTARPARLTGFALIVIAVLFIQLLLGAWTAGLNAGYVASDWPMMNDRLVPAGIDWSGGLWAAMSNDPFLIHFAHRWWSWVAAAALVMLALRLRRHRARGLAALLVLIVIGQMGLGIATVISGVSLWIAVLHQVIGAVLVAASAASLHRLGRRIA